VAQRSKHVLVLQGPGVQHGQTEISVDDVGCHQWLTNQIAEAPLHWSHINVYQLIKYLSLTHHVEASSVFMSATKKVRVSAAYSRTDITSA